MEEDVRLSPDHFDVVEEYRKFLQEVEGSGAVASFTGMARPTGSGGSTVHSLFLDHHPRLTLASMKAIAVSARQRFGVSALRLVHRVGAVDPADTIVFVAAAAPHRRAALEAVDYLMDRVKTDAVFWKREDRSDGSEWIEPTDQDRAARNQWEEQRGGD